MATPYQYVVTAHPSTAVSQAVVCNFIGTRNLVIARFNRVQIWCASRSELRMECDLPVFGRILVLRSFRPCSSSLDWLFMITERLQFFVIAYNESLSQIDTKAQGDASDKIGRLTDQGVLGLVNPACTMIGMHIYDGLLKIIPMTEGGTVFGTAYNMRLEELMIISMTFLLVAPSGIPTLVVLFEDTRRVRFVRTYIVDMEMKELKRGQWPDAAVDVTSDRVESVPAPLGGYLIFANNEIVYRVGSFGIATATAGAPITAFGWIDEDGSRSLIGDADGSLSILQLTCTNGSVSQIDIERIGHTSQSSTLSYLDNGFVFVGSRFGDSQLIRLTAEPDPFREFVQVQETFPNLGPIVDMSVLNLEQRCGQCQLVTCSGTLSDGSLRLICNGIGLQVHTSAPISGFHNMWSIRRSMKSKKHQLLVLAFESETRVLEASPPIKQEPPSECSFAECSSSGFALDVMSLFCGNVSPNFAVQISSSSVRIMSCKTWSLLYKWTTQTRSEVDDGPITVATAAGNHILLALHNGSLHHLQVQNDGSIVSVSQQSFDADISCLSIDSDRGLVAAGFWSTLSIKIISLVGFKEIAATSGFDEYSCIPRSLALIQFSPLSPLFLLCGRTDGSVVSYIVNIHERDELVELTEINRVILGTHPVTLTPFTSHSSTPTVFALCDRPNLIGLSNTGPKNELIFTSCNLKDIICMTPFTVSGLGSLVVLGSDDGMTIGMLDSAQKLHVRKIALKQQPRRLAHDPNLHCLLVCTMEVLDPSQTTYTADGPTEYHYIKIFDDQTFEELDVVKLQPFENACSAEFATLDGQDCFVVGTGFTMPGDEEAASGRILVYSFDPKQRKLVVEAQKTVNGGVYALNAFLGKILSTVNCMTYLWSRAPELTDDDDNDMGIRSLVYDCSHQGHVLSTHLRSLGNFYIVGDLIKSLTLMVYDPAGPALREVARDFDQNWTTAVEMLDGQTYLFANNSLNLQTMTKNLESFDEEERARLQISGRFHVGEFINSIHHGSLVATQNLDIHPQCLFGTTTGMIGVTASLSEGEFKMLDRIQSVLQQEVNTLGGLSHRTWRSFHNSECARETIESHNYIDGDLMESVLSWTTARKQKVAQQLGISAGELTSCIQRLRAIH